MPVKQFLEMNIFNAGQIPLKGFQNDFETPHPRLRELFAKSQNIVWLRIT